MSATQLSRTHRVLIGVVLVGALVIAAIGFAGSYAAVRDLAERKGFGSFAPFFPIGIDAGIVVLLALDLLLTWLRIGFPLLRQTAWLLTAATIAFNGAAAWPDPLGVGMHAVIPVLFVVSVEAARHAIGRIADITADRHMEGVRVSRWLLAFPSTFRLWRRMKLWELRSYDEVIRLEQERLVYRTRLRARYGRAWRRRAPVEDLMPLKLARYGIPLSRSVAALAATPTPSAEASLTGPPAEQRPEHREPPAAPEPDRSPAPRPAPAETAPVPERVAEQPAAAAPEPEPAPVPVREPAPEYVAGTQGRRPIRRPPAPPEPVEAPADEPTGVPDGVPVEDVYFQAYRDLAARGARPTARDLSRALNDRFGVTNRDGGLLSEAYLRPYVRECRERLNEEIGVVG
ncbi:hypothetical protein GCM10023347_10270 [Streptomyces chumphonensis]|uniref:DUF2637 domain-containing protein n=1 Tax=Streptomyces chumphonensis TaxID=1214925 RepID=A0A927F411_9ACTN|nr:DUF2637 domain-containing protein [Streptomyces chumphonensis]MBD3933967.1 DUF2637 domain-containing protein [Streptomyces chumphonensis]